MATKSSTTTATRSRTLTSTEVTTALKKGAGMTATEEQVVRMRQGAKAAPGQVLERKAAEGSEAGDELMLMEMQLLKAYRAHLAAKQAKAAPAKAAARPSTDSRAKEKIVRALRNKK